MALFRLARCDRQKCQVTKLAYGGAQQTFLHAFLALFMISWKIINGFQRSRSTPDSRSYPTKFEERNWKRKLIFETTVRYLLSVIVRIVH